jgi:hypothetical protein
MKQILEIVVQRISSTEEEEEEENIFCKLMSTEHGKA